MKQVVFADMMRRIVTATAGDSRSTIILDDSPSCELGKHAGSGLHEIWSEIISPALASSAEGQHESALSPSDGEVKVRWFVVNPDPEGVPNEKIHAAVRRVFRGMGAENELRDQSRHATMHQTNSLDVVCLLSGDASLIVDDCETRLSPGQVVIQRGTSHAWQAHNGPALFLAVLIGCQLNKP